MTYEEHKAIIAFIDATLRPEEVPAPMDVEADAIIRALFVRNPEAAYRITRLAMAQQAKLAVLRRDLADAELQKRASWFARLLKRQERQARGPRSGSRAAGSRAGGHGRDRPRLEPDFAELPQDLGGS